MATPKKNLIAANHLKQVSPITTNQAKFYHNFHKYQILAMLDMVACGKTYLALHRSLQEVLDNRSVYQKIILIRSAVSVRDLGFLPGTLEEKLEVFEEPFIQICADLLERVDAYTRLKEQKKLEFVSSSYLRGITFQDCIVIVDEIENMTIQELDTIVTRAGENTKMIFLGDANQNDLINKPRDRSGYEQFVNVLEKMDAAYVINFGVDDIVRSGLVKDYIVARYGYERSPVRLVKN